MNPRLSYFVMLALTVLLGIGVIGGAFFGDYILQKQTDKLVSLKLDSKVLDAQQSSLIQANKDIAKYANLENIAKTIVPQDKDQARVVREIVGYANDLDIPIQDIAFPTSTLGQNNSSSSAAGTAPVTKSVASQLKAVTGLSGVYQMDITVQSDTTKPVPYNKVVAFLQKLENNRRTAQVTGLSISPNTQDRQLITFTLTVSVYVKP